MTAETPVSTNGGLAMTPADTLRAAADHMEKVGKYEGDYYRDEECADSPCCAVGAIWAVSGHVRWLAVDALEDSLRCSVPTWSDLHDKPTVVAGMRAAAAQWDRDHRDSEELT